jgi:hypothetical protein
LQNCEARLALLYPGQSLSQFGNRPEQGAWIHIRIPLRPATEQKLEAG